VRHNAQLLPVIDSLLRRLRTTADIPELQILAPKPMNLIRHEEWSALTQNWEAAWEEGNTGRLTYEFIPNVTTHNHIPVNSALTQFLTGHGKFNEYLHRFHLRDSPACPCGAPIQDVPHLLWRCPFLEPQRQAIREAAQQKGLGWPITNHTLLSSLHQGFIELTSVYFAMDLADADWD
jgi:hypothetical protein